MSTSVQLRSGTVLRVEPAQSILEAAESAGVTLEYSCRTGRCSTCKALVSSGATTALAPESGLTAEKREDGWILTCVRTPSDDVVLAVDSELDTALPPVKTVPARINALQRLSDDVVEIVLRIPPTSGWTFLPGQHLEVTGPGGGRRAYSIANAASPSGTVTLHVRHVEGGEFSSYWFGAAAAEDLLRFRGPLGTFFLRAADDAPLVFLATGTGIAPVKAILEDLAQRGETRPVHLYFGGRHREDLYWAPPADWPDTWHFVPVLSRPDPGWDGRSGYVQDVMLADRLDLSTAEVYACGSDAMVHGARSLALDNGVDERRFFADAFVSSTPVMEAAR